MDFSLLFSIGCALLLVLLIVVLKVKTGKNNKRLSEKEEQILELNNVVESQKNLILAQRSEINTQNIGINRLKELASKVESQKKSSEVRLGLIGENFAPLISSSPYDHKRFHFLANPCDGVYFGDDEVVFMEFKTGSAKLSKSQKNIQDIIAKGNVRFEVFRIDDTGAHLKVGSRMEPKVN